MSTRDDMTKVCITALAGAGTGRGAALAMELQRGMNRRTHPEREVQHKEVEAPANDTTPATVMQYVNWLKGFVESGRVPTHSYDYSFDRMRFRYAPDFFVVNGECGASSHHVILGRGARVLNPNPWKPFGGYGHNELFLMDRYEVAGGVVPVFSDPEFDPYRSRLTSRG